MKMRLISWCRRFADWLEGPKLPNTALQFTAEKLVTWADTLKGVSGEYKRHQVYAMLIKDFPAEPKRKLSLAIEQALNK